MPTHDPGYITTTDRATVAHVMREEARNPERLHTLLVAAYTSTWQPGEHYALYPHHSPHAQPVADLEPPWTLLYRPAWGLTAEGLLWLAEHDHQQDEAQEAVCDT